MKLNYNKKSVVLKKSQQLIKLKSIYMNKYKKLNMFKISIKSLKWIKNKENNDGFKN